MTTQQPDAPDARPVPDCGTDFCDSSGDCLACFGGDPCAESPDYDDDTGQGGTHTWAAEDRDRALQRAKEPR